MRRVRIPKNFIYWRLIENDTVWLAIMLDAQSVMMLLLKYYVLRG